MKSSMNAHDPRALGVKGTKQILMGFALAVAVMVPQWTLAAAGPAPVNLGSTAHFTILAGAAVTSTGGGIINGDVGASPIAGSAIGVTQAQVNGLIYAVDASGPAGAVIDPVLLTTAKGDLTIAYNDAAGRTPIPSGPFRNPGAAYSTGYNIGGLTLVPGLYKFDSTAFIVGSDVTLTGGPDDVWIFQCSADLQLGSGIHVILAGGAQARNIFWQVTSSAVLDTSSVFKGTIIAAQAVTMKTSSTIEGRALAFTAGVTFDGVSITLPASGPVKAKMTSPANGTTNTSASVTFIWDAGVGVTQYALWVGSNPSSYDLYGAAETGLSRTLTLPTDGRTLYVNLWSWINGAWQSNSYTYTAASPVKAGMLRPINATTLPGASTTFIWDTGVGVTQYALWVGSALQTYDIYAGVETGQSRKLTLPTDGRTIYVTLWSWMNAAWQSNAYTYTAYTTPAAVKSVMISPANGSTINGGVGTFIWDSGVGVSQRVLWVGRTPGSYNIYYAVEPGLARKLTLPRDNSTIYVTLWSWINGAYQSNAYSYICGSGAAPPAAAATMFSPTGGATLTDASTTFIWDADSGVTLYRLWVGSAPSSYDIYYAYETGQSRKLTLPTDGRVLYVTLWSWLGGAWQSNAYTYTAYTAPTAKAVMLAPTPGTTLTSKTTTFIWDTGTGIPAWYVLWVGSGPSTYDIYYAVETGQSRKLTLPTDGRTIYVTLWSWINGAWQPNPFTYKAFGP